MSIPKEWSSKPVARGLPYAVRNGCEYRMCHNCVQFYPSSLLSSCTGMCKECMEENNRLAAEYAADAPRPTTPDGRPSWLKCKKCHREVRRFLNIGILRDVCHWCKVEYQPPKQRCGSCNTFFKDCWNNVCRRCRFRKFLCDKKGWFYKDEEHHRERCWCILSVH